MVHQANALSTGVAYISPFCYADPVGVFGNSSIAIKPFDADGVDQNEADRLFARLQRRLIGRWLS